MDLFTFKFVYSDGKECIIDNVNKVTFFRNETITVESDKILVYNFPIDRILHLFSIDGSSVISDTDLRYITIAQQ